MRPRAAAVRALLRRRAVRGLLLVLVVLVELPIALDVTFRIAVGAADFPAAEARPPRGSWRILDADGRVLRETVSEEGTRAAWISIDRMPRELLAATVAVEDARFFEHDGVDRVAVARALWQNARGRRVVSGASTITMQLARLIRPRERGVGAKIVEMIEAGRIERRLGKREILEQYLNRAPFGAGTVGVEAASRRYFGKPAEHLSLAESALLAGLLKAPTRLNPFVNPDGALARRRFVLARMRAASAIDDDALRRADGEPLALVPPADRPRAMHFTEWVLAGRPARGELTTTLQSDLQEQLEQLTAEHVRSLAPSGVTNAAAIVLDNRRCEVLAMVGSADYWAQPDGAVNGALARRQPGSTLKPFTYAMAFERGSTPASVVADVEGTWGAPGRASFAPRNYSGTFAGPVLMGDALARSLNVPAIRVAEQVGVEALLGKLREVGFTSLDGGADRYGLGLTLGNGEVTLLELAQGYATFARGGRTCRATPWREGDVHETRAFSPEAAWLVTDVLSDELARIEAFGPGSALLIGFPVAVKTGTSSNWRDSWAVGYTDRFTVAVWTGDFGGRPLERVAGANGAGPLFHRVMRRVIERGGPSARPQLPDPPDGVVEVTVCALSGLASGPHCPHKRGIHVHADHLPSKSCDWHREVAIDDRTGLLAGPSCPAHAVSRRTFTVLPSIYTTWAAGAGWPAPPTLGSPSCPPAGVAGGAVSVSFPHPGDVFVIEPGYDRRTQTLPLAAAVDPPRPQVTWIIDGVPVATVGWPYRAEWRLAPGAHEVAVRAGDLTSDPVVFEVR